MNLDSTFVVMQPDIRGTGRRHADHLRRARKRFGGFKGRVLVSCHTFDPDWESWEMHPVGEL